MADRFPGYDVMTKRDGVSWNDATRRAIDARLARPDTPRFFDAQDYGTLGAVCARIVPQPPGRPPVAVRALVDEKLALRQHDGYRDARLPPEDVAWRRGLRALDAEARAAHETAFADCPPEAQDALLRRMQDGALHDAAWQGMPPATFFRDRLVRDIVHAYYAHPVAWNEIGFGGPASPRGYVRMGFDRRDPWEAAEDHGGDREAALRANRHVR